MFYVIISKLIFRLPAYTIIPLGYEVSPLTVEWVTLENLQPNTITVMEWEFVSLNLLPENSQK